MKYFVSRQAYWPTGELVVEIAEGGCEYSNPDMLSDPDNIYGPLGDMLETQDPREALEAAFRIRDKWNQELRESCADNGACRIEAGFTHGMTMPFESYPADEELKKWAQETWEATPKCDCGEPLPEHPYKLCFPYEGDEEFCSEYCADEAYDFYVRQDSEEDDGLLA